MFVFQGKHINSGYNMCYSHSRSYLKKDIPCVAAQCYSQSNVSIVSFDVVNNPTRRDAAINMRVHHSISEFEIVRLSLITHLKKYYHSPSEARGMW